MASTDTPKTVLLRGDPIAGEALAAGAITPGNLLMRTSAGRVQRNTGAGVKTPILIARELEVTGKSIADDYAADDQVLFYSARSGDWFYAILAQGEDVAIGDLLTGNNAGALVAVGTGEEPLFQALQAVDNDPGTGVARIKVEVL